jgi:hypothetical protein
MAVNLFADPLWLNACAQGLALLLAAAGLHKLKAPRAFSAVLQGYRLLPAGLLLPLGVLLALLELLAAAGLLWSPWRTPGALLAAGLLLLYALVMALSLWRATAVADCGCHFGGHRQRVSAALVWRNLLLVAVALNLLQPPLLRDSSWLDAVLGALLLLAGILFYLLANALIANASSARELSL